MIHNTCTVDIALFFTMLAQWVTLSWSWQNYTMIHNDSKAVQYSWGRYLRRWQNCTMSLSMIAKLYNTYNIVEDAILGVDSHSYGKISSRRLKERPHNLTKWTLLPRFARYFSSPFFTNSFSSGCDHSILEIRWQIRGPNPTWCTDIDQQTLLVWSFLELW